MRSSHELVDFFVTLAPCRLRRSAVDARRRRCRRQRYSPLRRVRLGLMLTPSRPFTARSLHGSTRPTSARPWTASSTAGYSTRPSTARSSSAWCAPPPTVNKTWLQVKEGIDAAGAAADARERALKREVLGAQLRRERDAGVARQRAAASARAQSARRMRSAWAAEDRGLRVFGKDMLRIEAAEARVRDEEEAWMKVVRGGGGRCDRPRRAERPRPQAARGAGVGDLARRRRELGRDVPSRLPGRDAAACAVRQGPRSPGGRPSGGGARGGARRGDDARGREVNLA